MYVKQIDQNTALDLCKKGIEVKVLMADNDGDWKEMIPDTLQNVLDGCMFFREEPAIENQKLENALEAVPKALPKPVRPQPCGYRCQTAEGRHREAAGPSPGRLDREEDRRGAEGE